MALKIKVSVRNGCSGGGFHAVATSVWQRPGVTPEEFMAEATGHTKDEAKTAAKSLLRANQRFQFANSH